jgi:hypothetical protein
VTSTPVTATATRPPGFEGCTPGYWKARPHLDSWPPTGFSPNQTVGSVFTIPAEFSDLADDTLLEALSYGGGDSDQEAAQILLRHAVAALLNASHPGVDYPQSPASVIADTNAALASSDRDTMLDQKDEFKDQNEAGCPLN